VRRLFTAKWCLAHLAVLAAILVMLRLGLWQWHRAESRTGGIQNYAYALQWPLFAVFGIVVWVKTLIEESKRHGSAEPAAERTSRHQALPPEQAGIVRQPGMRVGVSTRVQVDDDDVETQEWNARLKALNAAAASVRPRQAGR
jgi:DNA-binding transcriptional regulator of glucitol operon